MSVKKLDFARPFFEDVEFVENEAKYFVEPKSIVINLAYKTHGVIDVEGLPLEPLKAAILQGVVVNNVERALVFRNYDQYDVTCPETAALIEKTWKSLYEWSGQERQKGIPYHKTEKIALTDDTSVTVCYAAPMSPSGPHKTHAKDVTEVHIQLQGMGKVQLFREKEPETFYREFIMAPGSAHDRIFGENGEYPWHQYCSVTASIYVPVEIEQ